MADPSPFQEVLISWQGHCQVVQLLWLFWDLPEECPVDHSGWGLQDPFPVMITVVSLTELSPELTGAP